MVQETVLKLKELGRMPDGSDDILKEYEYANLIDSVQKPINKQEAEILISLFPEYGLYGVEWSLLHLVESIYHLIPVEDY